MPAARIHERIDAGPALFRSVERACSSHPDPMIEPSEMNISPQKPTDRRSRPAVRTVPSSLLLLMCSAGALARHPSFRCHPSPNDHLTANANHAVSSRTQPRRDRVAIVTIADGGEGPALDLSAHTGPQPQHIAGA